VTQPFIRAVAVFFLAVSAAVAQGETQTPSTPPKIAGDPNRVLPVRVQVVVARYQGDKRISSMPYTMSVNAIPTRGVGQIRIGADIPISMGLMPPPADGKQAIATPGISYEQIGTQIDCRVTPTDDGRYVLELTVSEKSVYPNGEGPNVSRPAGNPPFRSFRTNNTMILKDGQSAEFAAAGDRLTGEIIRVDATLNVLK
jgi:hypothetical protein